MAKKHWLFKKEGKKFKRFELSPQVLLKQLYTIFFFARERKTQIPPRYIPSKPYKKILITSPIDNF